MVSLGNGACSHRRPVVTNWMAARWFQIIGHLPYSPDLALADFFLFSSVKRELAGKTLTEETLKQEWEGNVETLSAADFVKAPDGGLTAVKSVLRSLADMSRKAKNTKCPYYHRFLFIGVVRVQGKHTPYVIGRK